VPINPGIDVMGQEETPALQQVALLFDDLVGDGEQRRRNGQAEGFGGAPAQVVDMLLAQHRAGITHLSMRVSWPGMGQDDILAGIELLGRQVLPKVRRATSAYRPQP
jgi:alkanesulfonate monooxygenase SsuD/methylene tetrahydromethanopterin reductase-like flavin-dependent oxidoreductase (luciferase family)